MSFTDLAAPSRRGLPRRRSSTVESSFDSFSPTLASVKKTHEFPDGPVSIQAWAADYLATVGAAVGPDQARERQVLARMVGLHVSRVALYASSVPGRKVVGSGSSTASSPRGRVMVHEPVNYAPRTLDLSAKGVTAVEDHRHYALVAEVSMTMDSKNTHRVPNSHEELAQVEGYIRIEGTCRPALFENDKAQTDSPPKGVGRALQYDEELSKVLTEKLIVGSDAPATEPEEFDPFISPFMSPNPSVAATRANSRSQPGSYHVSLDSVGEEESGKATALDAKGGVQLVASTMEREPAEFFVVPDRGHTGIRSVPISKGHASREGNCLLFLSNDRDKQTGKGNHLILRDFIFLLDIIERTADDLNHGPMDKDSPCMGLRDRDVETPAGGCCCCFFERFCATLPLLSDLEGSVDGVSTAEGEMNLDIIKHDLQVKRKEFDEILSRVRESRKPRKIRHSSLQTHGEVDEGSPPLMPTGLVADHVS